MRAASLLGVFLAARLLLLLDRPLPLSVWTPFAFLWQDLLVALAFLLLDLRARRSRAGWALYGLVVFYTAINVPLIRVLSSPLTFPMLRATRGTLADSIVHYFTAANLLLLGVVLALGAALPYLLQRLPRRALIAGAALALPVVALGPYASSRIDARGLDRNVLVALVASGFPRLSSERLERDWRESPFPSAPSEDLSGFRGVAGGRNVLLVSLESTGAIYLAPYGAAEDPTPGLSALARKAILFENAYSAYPESIKGLFSLLTSLAPALDVAAEVHARVPSRSLAAALSSAGYRTGLFHSGRFMYLGMDAIVRGLGFGTLEDAGDIGGERNSSFGVDEPSAVKRILSWIDRSPDERFLVSYLPIAGHHPYETPKGGPFSEREEIGRYRNALRYGDAAVGELLDGLRTRGLEQKTLVVLLGDHGEAFQQHQGNTGHTFFIYEENVRVPLLFLCPGRIEESVRVRRVASLLDVAPTVLDLLGLPAPPSYQGRSLLDGRPRLALFFTDYSLALLGLRDGPWKLIHEIESGRSSLFDLSADPSERSDLAARFPDRVRSYREHLLAWGRAQRELILGASGTPSGGQSRGESQE